MAKAKAKKPSKAAVKRQMESIYLTAVTIGADYPMRGSYPDRIAFCETARARVVESQEEYLDLAQSIMEELSAKEKNEVRMLACVMVDHEYTWDKKSEELKKRAKEK